uniref:Secreted protein n=1 Tax=Steinernema glaseri TaxID=37863 RepID=A0A1I7Z8D1_9BILA
MRASNSSIYCFNLLLLHPDSVVISDTLTTKSPRAAVTGFLGTLFKKATCRIRLDHIIAVLTMRSLLLVFLLLHVVHSCRLINAAPSTVSDVLEHIRKGRIALYELSKFANASKIPELADTVGRLSLDLAAIRRRDSEGRLLMNEMQSIRDGLSELLDEYKEFTYQLHCPLLPSYYDDVRMRIINSYENIRMDWHRPLPNATGFQMCHECFDVLVLLRTLDSDKYSTYMNNRFCNEQERSSTVKNVANADLTLLAVMSKMCGYFTPQTMELNEDLSQSEKLDDINKQIHNIIKDTQF